MKTEFYISNKISNAKEHKNTLSRPIGNLSILVISISVFIMILSSSILRSFQEKIVDIVADNSSHINVSGIKKNQYGDILPIQFNSSIVDSVSNLKNVISVDPIVSQLGLIKTDKAFAGLMFKSLDSSRINIFKDENIFFENVKCEFGELMISDMISSFLNIQYGDSIWVHFINNDRIANRGRPVFKKLMISGIFESNQFNENLAYMNIDDLREIKGYFKSEVDNLEIRVNHLQNIESVLEKVVVFDTILNRYSTIYESEFSDVFDWLNMLDMNVIIINLLMYIVSILSIVSISVILIIEKTYMIGVLKALGLSNFRVINIFLIKVMSIVFRGVLFGNILAVVLIFLQSKFKILTLDPSIYYLKYVPVSIYFDSILYINLISIFLSFIFILIPSIIILKITPLKAIRFE